VWEIASSHLGGSCSIQLVVEVLVWGAHGAFARTPELEHTRKTAGGRERAAISYCSCLFVCACGFYAWLLSYSWPWATTHCTNPSLQHRQQVAGHAQQWCVFPWHSGYQSYTRMWFAERGDSFLVLCTVWDFCHHAKTEGAKLWRGYSSS